MLWFVVVDRLLGAWKMKARNFVAKHSHLAGKSGAHDAKMGKHVKRAIAKAIIRKQIKEVGTCE